MSNGSRLKLGLCVVPSDAGSGSLSPLRERVGCASAG